MHKYLAFYKGKQIEVEATSSYNAQTKAASEFRAKRAWDVSVKLVEKADGTPVIHDGASL